MRTLAMFSGAIFVLAVGLQQPSLPSILARDYERLAASPTLTVGYTLRVVGDVPAEYKLTLAKPNMFRLTTPTGFTLADGKSVFVYTAATKSYTETPLTEAWLTEFARSPEAFGWAPFLLKNPAAEVLSVQPGVARMVQGKAVTEVPLVLKKGPAISSLFIDKELSIARGYRVTVGDKEYLATATTIEIGKAAPSEGQFAFVAPDGARRADVVDTKNLFAQVQGIINTSCMPCHNAQNRAEGLDLTTYEGIVATVRPGEGAASRLVRSLRASGRKRMPLRQDPLPEVKIATIEKWIDDGAKKD